ncbi:MAG TPA: nucleotidyltransferase [Sphingobacteriaceae bacterium]|nr:nucleotidyltransferase [Sphingobacteriaceae bacterium]
MHTQRTLINQLEKFTSEVKLMGIHLRKAVLYGSYAKNEQHKWSDIDLALVADEFEGIGPEDVKLISKALIKFKNLDIQPRTYNTQDFSPEIDPFVGEILKTGIVIEG